MTTITGNAQAADNANTAASWLRYLRARGVQYLFANAGTDFAPIIEAYARAGKLSGEFPVPVTVPHENVAIHMAIGHWLVSRQMQAVMVHVNVGTANAICGLLNASRGHVPLLFAAGRTPVTELGELGSRNLHIHWSQEMFDQAALVREASKWDYELRMPSQVEAVVNRAVSIANTAPRGPVSLTLPREVLAAPASAVTYGDRQAPARIAGITESSLASLAQAFQAARAPLIITSAMATEEEGAHEQLASFADAFGVPVVQLAPRCANLPSAHPMHAGYDPTPWVRRADLILVLDALVPWYPDRTDVSHAKVVQIAADPLYSESAVRSFESDLSIVSSPSAALAALAARLQDWGVTHAALVAARREAVVVASRRAVAAQQELAESVKTQQPIHPAWFTHCLNRVKPDDAIVVREAPQLNLALVDVTRPDSLMNAGAAGGLGWGLGVAIGAKMAAPDRQVIAVEGDGAYMFCTPVAAHYVALEQDAPFLTVIFNNQRWNEVRAATRHVYPDGAAAKAHAYEPLTHFHPALELHQVVRAVGGHGERVTDPALLEDALRRGLEIVKDQRRQVVIDVVCAS
jgi:acetolactate synthase-1/2/3 large subunit